MNDVLSKVETVGEVLDSKSHGKSFESITESKDMDIKVEVDHWRVDKSALQNAIRSIKLFGGISSATAFSRSVFIERHDGQLTLKCNNRDIFLEVSVPLLNEDLILDGKFIVNVADFDLLVRSGMSNIIIYKNTSGNSLKMMGFGGEFVIDLQNFDFSIYNFPKIPEEKDSTSYSVADVDSFRDTIAVLRNLTSLAIRPDDRYIMVEKGVGVGSFITLLVRVMLKDITDISLRLMDMNFLYSLLPDTNTLKCVISTTGSGQERVFYFGDNFAFSCQRVFADVNANLKIFDTPSPHSSNVDVDQLLGIAQIVSKITGYSSALEFVSTKSGTYLVSSTNTGNKSKFLLDSEGNLGEPFQVAVEIIRKVFSVFKGSMAVKLSRHQNGLVIQHNNIDIFVGIND